MATRGTLNGKQKSGFFLIGNNETGYFLCRDHDYFFVSDMFPDNELTWNELSDSRVIATIWDTFASPNDVLDATGLEALRRWLIGLGCPFPIADKIRNRMTLYLKA